jgi:tyrosinase
MNWRRNSNSLSQIEKDLFINAVKALKTPYNPKPFTGPTNRYNEYVAWHYDSGNKDTPPGDPSRTIAHSGPAFLPWHREFIRKFELDLQGKQTGITLPYWNWAQDSGLPDPKNTPIWQNFLGGNGDSNDNWIVKSGPFAVGNWIIADENGQPSSTGNNPRGGLQRAFGQVPGIDTLPTLNDVNNALGEFPFDAWPWNPLSSNHDKRTSFRNKLEGLEEQNNPVELHNRLHVWVGGSMEPFTSPNDPVFFLHHCYVDRIWDRWQILNGLRYDYPADGEIRTQLEGGQPIVGHNRNDAMYPWNKTTVGNVLDSLAMGVEYDPGNHAITAVATGSGRLEVFWIGSDGSVNGRSYVISSWGDPYQISGPGSASVPSGSITTVFDPQNHVLNVWWTRPDSSVEQIIGGYIDGVFKWNLLPRAINFSSTSGGLAAIVSNQLPFMFSIGCDSKVWWEYYNDTNWVYQPLTTMKWGSTSSGLTAVTRSANYMDVFWIEGDGSVKGQSYSYSPPGWGSQYTVAEPGSALGNSIVAVSRDTDKIDVWWIGPPPPPPRGYRKPYSQEGLLYWNSFVDGQWKGKLAINSGASIRGGLAAVARSPTAMEVYWIYNGGVYGMPWDSSNGWNGGLYTLAGPRASTSGGLAASMRDENNIDILWIGLDNSVVGTNIYYPQGPHSQTRFDALPTDYPSFKRYAASTGLPSDV